MPRNFDVPEAYQNYGSSKNELIQSAMKEGHTTKKEIEAFYNSEISFSASQIGQVRAKLAEEGEEKEQPKKRRKPRQKRQNGADLEAQNNKLRWLNHGLLKGWLTEHKGLVVLAE